MTELPTGLSIATIRAADCRPRKAWTHHDLDRMSAAGLFGPDERVELIDGEIVPMPAEGRRRERVRDALNVWLWEHLGKDEKVLAEPGWRPAERHAASARLQPLLVPELELQFANLGLDR